MRRIGWPVAIAAAAFVTCSPNAPQRAPAGPSEGPVGSAAGDEMIAVLPHETLPPTAQDTPRAQELRKTLVESIARREPGLDRRVLAALRLVPRHEFVPQAPLEAAYVDAPYPIGLGQTISQPTVVALMSSALRLTGRERVLEIGTGSGYQAAVLGHLAREVYTIELLEPLGVVARRRLEEHGFHNIHVRIGDGYQGWPEAAPFDRVLMTAAPREVPPALLGQLAEGGILVGPVGDREQELVRWTKKSGRLERESLGPVMFVPMVKPRPK